jgi:superfamily I DNA/RNA helicase
MEPTPEQVAILEFAVRERANLLIEALAGTGKTSTAEMVTRKITDRAILYLAFNKRIVTEAEKRMPSHVECRTQNSLGHRTWAQATGKRLIVDGDKNRNIMKTLVGELPRAQQQEAWEDYADTLKWMSRAKRDGYVPSRFTAPHRAIYSDMADWAARYDESLTRLQEHLIDQALLRDIEMAYAGGIDYDDQIYMPVIFGGPWPKFPLVVVDEVQDYNPLGHEMLSRLLPNNDQRLIAVGDPWQSIYAFRGAVYNGMRQMQERFAMHTLPLSVTFRVPKAGVRRANSRVPHYEAFTANIEGEVLEHDTWGPETIPDDAAIICRNNAPLISMAFALLRNGRAVKMVGFDIGAGLVRLLRKLGPESLSPEATRRMIEQWRDAELQKTNKPESVYDRAECLFALTAGYSLGDAIIRADNLFKQQKGINLLSGHKSKGLEWEEVFHLDAWRIPNKWAMPGTEAYEQELNVRYVIETRFKQRLHLINAEGFHDDDTTG